MKKLIREENSAKRRQPRDIRIAKPRQVGIFLAFPEKKKNNAFRFLKPRLVGVDRTDEQRSGEVRRGGDGAGADNERADPEQARERLALS